MLFAKEPAGIKNGTNLAWLVLVVIILSITMVSISVIIFFNSGAYDTVRQISAATNTLSRDDLVDYDTSSPIQSKDIELYSETLPKRVKDFNKEDFEQNAISESVLGY